MWEAKFYEAVEGAFSRLLKLGYTVVDRHCSARSFGNGWVTYQGNSLVLQILRERSQHLVELSVPGAHSSRFYYGTLREVLGRSKIDDLPDLPLKELAHYVIEDLPAIEKGYAPDAKHSLVKGA